MIINPLTYELPMTEIFKFSTTKIKRLYKCNKENGETLK